MASIKIATWNVNSVRPRMGLIRRFVDARKPDVLCLQEIKCTNDQFPEREFSKLGYTHMAINGQRAYHGVAILSKVPFEQKQNREFCGKVDSRHNAVTLPGGVILHNFYVPAGGDIPDPDENEKFEHKLNFLKEMSRWFKGAKNKATNKFVLVGDLNVAPCENDVWSHKQLLNVVSHTPVEVELLSDVLKSHSWIDVARRDRPEPEKLFTWWSYRSPDWTKNNRGRRLDHIWVTPALADRAHSLEILSEARSWEKPSDHAPVLMTLNL